MANKEAKVYIVDVGESTARKNNGRDISDLDWGLRYVWDKIANDVGTARKTLYSGVIAVRTDGTEHDMPREDSYDHITVVQPMKQCVTLETVLVEADGRRVLMPDLRSLTSKLKPSHTDDGDLMSALATALQMIEVFCKHLKYKKKIVIVTNGTGLMDASDLTDMIDKINKDAIELVVLGADFDDPDYGVKEEDKDDQKASNEDTLHKLADDCNGLFGSINQAVAELEIPRTKTTKPIPSYKGFLSLGNAKDNPDTAIAIDVERYPRTMIRPAPAASNFVLRSDADGETQDVATNGDDAQAGDGLASVKSLRAYQINDESAPGGKRDLERDELASGYEYGATVVPVSESDELVLKMETEPTYEIIGFIPVESFPHYVNLERSHFVVAQRVNDKAILGLSALIHALHELDSHAVARLVPKPNNNPILVLLSYEINNEYECLFENQLPFHEDVRSYKFPTLDRIITVSGKTLHVHRNLPNDHLQKAMDDVVDAMNLDGFDRDDEGNPAEYLSMDETFSPTFHRLNQAIRHRAVHPDSEVPPPFETILKPSHPPEELLERASKHLERLKAVADVKKVPPKTAFRKQKRQIEAPRSGLDVTELLQSHKKDSQAQQGTFVSPQNAIPDFRRILDTEEEIPEIQSAFLQLAKIIEGWVKDSFGDSKYEHAIEALGAMREQSIEMDEPGWYNDWLKDFKSKLFSEKLGGDRKEMWWKVRRSRLGLVDSKASEKSEVDEAAAKEFMSSR